MIEGNFSGNRLYFGPWPPMLFKVFCVVLLVKRVDRAPELFFTIFLPMVVQTYLPVFEQSQCTLLLYCILK